MLKPEKILKKSGSKIMTDLDIKIFKNSKLKLLRKKLKIKLLRKNLKN